MARIKDFTLTTTLAGDDYVPLDGATNGTRAILNTHLRTALGIGTGNTPVFAGLTATGEIRTANLQNILVRNAADNGPAVRLTADASNYAYLDAAANTELRLQVGSGTKLSITNTGHATLVGNFTAAGAAHLLGSNGGSSVTLALNGAASQLKFLVTQTGGVDRWYMGQNSTAEAGANAGSNFQLVALADAGTTIDIPVHVARAAGGAITLARPLTVTGAVTLSGTGTHTVAGALSMTTSQGSGGAAGLPGFVTVGAGGATSLPSATGGGLFFDMGASPTKRLFYGDGTGYSLALATRVGGVATDRFTFSDDGTLVMNTVGGRTIRNSADAGSLVLEAGSTTTGGGYVTRITLTGGFAGSNTGCITLEPSQSGSVRIKGTPTNDNAATGFVGEYLSSTIASGSAVALTTATAANITSLALTAGDWDVEGNVVFAPAATTVRNRSIAAIGTSTLTLPVTMDLRGIVTYGTADGTANGYTVPAPALRVSVASPTTVYLVTYADFTAGAQTAFGSIRARRVR